MSNQTISNTQTFEACISIETGPNFTIQGSSGNVKLRAGDNVTLNPGTTVEPNGTLDIVIETPE
ncbi:MAG: hypothetical protein GY727_03250 [Gammaproteobacteria bacterium]|nr:hypothetical protein [Gammaproteobacteria bacterium]